jgi:hypothetical protein
MILCFFQGLPDSGNDVRVSATAADVAGHGFTDLLIGFGMTFVDQADCRTDLPGSAVATLESVVFDKCRLHRMELACRRQTFDGGDLIVLVHDGQRETGIDALAVDKDGAGAALAVIAALLGSGEADVFAQGIE